MVAAFGLVVALDLPDAQGRDGRFVAIRGANPTASAPGSIGTALPTSGVR